jgi:hypothetical protein
MGPNITLENVSGRIHLKFDAILEIKTKIEFLARNFVDCSMNFLISVDFNILCQNLSHPLLAVLSGDHLCEFVLSRIQRDESQVQLLEFIRFEFISSEILSKVLSYLEQVSPTLNCTIWNQITLRLKRTYEERPTSKLHYARLAQVIVELDSLSPVLGIIDMLTKSCGGNVHDKGVLTVTPSAGGHAAMTCNAIVD